MMRRITFSLAVCGMVAVVAAGKAAIAAEQRAVADLVKSLNMSGYSSPMRAPDWSGRTADGKTLSLSALRGRVILINFWATWCQECRPEMPLFQRMHGEFATQGLSVIGINAREGTVAVRGYAKELGLTFPLVLDPEGKIGTTYGVIGLPTTFLIGRDGRAVALGVGPREWASAEARVLMEILLNEQLTR
ncbi:MAG TPA: TlpA disulfide reductase family protein [Candidatus Binatia bacterium]|nr:TlpA disulfide reductase family protein [Candidatus Binatia bacterium]